MRLLKREIGTVNTRVLNTRYCEILHKGETLPANEISTAEAREILWIEDELHRRLITCIGHDFYPPDPKPKKIKIGLKITITNSVGNIIVRQNVKVNSKTEADIMAREMIEQLGLKSARYKIS